MRPFSRRRYDLNHFEWLEQFELLKRLEPFERSEQYDTPEDDSYRSEEHTSELQSQSNLVCRLLPEKTTRQPIPPLPNPVGQPLPAMRVPTPRSATPASRDVASTANSPTPSPTARHLRTTRWRREHR